MNWKVLLGILAFSGFAICFDGNNGFFILQYSDTKCGTKLKNKCYDTKQPPRVYNPSFPEKYCFREEEGNSDFFIALTHSYDYFKYNLTTVGLALFLVDSCNKFFTDDHVILDVLFIGANAHCISFEVHHSRSDYKYRPFGNKTLSFRQFWPCPLGFFELFDNPEYLGWFLTTGFIIFSILLFIFISFFIGLGINAYLSYMKAKQRKIPEKKVVYKELPITSDKTQCGTILYVIWSYVQCFIMVLVEEVKNVYTLYLMIICLRENPIESNSNYIQSFEVSNFLLRISYIFIALNILIDLAYVFMFSNKYLSNPTQFVIVYSALRETFISRFISVSFRLYFVCISCGFFFGIRVYFNYYYFNIIQNNLTYDDIVLGFSIPIILLLREILLILNSDGKSCRNFLKILRNLPPGCDSITKFPKFSFSIHHLIMSPESILENCMTGLSIITSQKDLEKKENDSKFSNINFDMIKKLNNEEIEYFRWFFFSESGVKESSFDVLFFGPPLTKKWMFSFFCCWACECCSKDKKENNFDVEELEGIEKELDATEKEKKLDVGEDEDEKEVDDDIGRELDESEKEKNLDLDEDEKGEDDVGKVLDESEKEKNLDLGDEEDEKEVEKDVEK